MIIYATFIVIILVIFSLFQIIKKIRINFNLLIVVVGRLISGMLMNMSVNPSYFI
jgi:hypothetical protein